MLKTLKNQEYGCTISDECPGLTMQKYYILNAWTSPSALLHLRSTPNVASMTSELQNQDQGIFTLPEPTWEQIRSFQRLELDDRHRLSLSCVCPHACWDIVLSETLTQCLATRVRS